MSLSNVLSLMGGLALFLYGMKMMSEGLERVAGNNLQKILEKLTTNRYLGVLVGLGITAVIQSSSATTVMVVGFVNAGLMNLSQAVGVIMGANIGTTVTGQLIALDITEIAPLFALFGVVLVAFFKGRKVTSIGEIIAGLGILFIGMQMMGSSMEPLRYDPMFINLMTSFKNPLFGILAGALFTGIIQSSSASIGILQTLAMNGLIPLSGAAYVLFGQNIGTCITAVLSSLGSNRNAKRVAIIHLLFNVFGTCLFVGICLMSPLVPWIESFTPTNPAAQIANLHTLFNVVSTLVLLPFAGYLVKLSTILLKDKTEKDDQVHIHVPNMRIGSISVALFDLQREIDLMYAMCNHNVSEAMKALIEHKQPDALIRQNEETIDRIHREIIKTIPMITSLSMTIEDSRKLSVLFSLNSDIERIGDHALNLTEQAEEILESNIAFSEASIMELKKIQTVLSISLTQFRTIEDFKDAQVFDVLSKNEYLLDDLCDDFRENQMERIKDHTCGAEASVIYSEILIDVERIGDHIFNIANSLYKGQITTQD